MGHNKRTAQKSKAQLGSEKRWTVGIDLGDQWSRYCVLDEEGEIAEEGRFKTAPERSRNTSRIPSRCGLL